MRNHLGDPSRVVTPPRRPASVGVALPLTPVLGEGVAKAGWCWPRPPGESRSSAVAAASFTGAGLGATAAADLNRSCSRGCRS